MVFPGVGGNKVKVTIEGDAKPLKKDLDKADRNVRKFASDVGGEVGGLATKIGASGAAIGAALAIGVGAAVVSTIGSANDLNESINAVGVIFGGASDKILEFGETSATSIGTAQTAFNESVIPIGALLSNFGLATDDVAEKTLLLTQRAADLGSTLNIDTAIGLDKMRAGLAGESEPLRAFGVDVSVAALTVEALNMGLISQGEKLDKTSKAQAAFSIIMRETEFAAGDFANTLDESLSNKMKVFTARVEDAKAAVGEALLPAAMALLDVLIDLIPVVERVADAFGPLIDVFERAARGARRVARAVSGAYDAVTDGDTGIDLSRDKAQEYEGTLKDAAKSATELAESLGIVKDPIIDFAVNADGSAIRQSEWNAMMAEGTDGLATFGPGIERAADQVDSFTDAQEDTADAAARADQRIRDQRDTLRSLNDPLFAAVRAVRELESAQDDVNAAEAEFGTDSTEYVTALMDQADAAVDMRDALALLKSKGIDPTSQAARDFFTDLGFTQAETDAIVNGVSDTLDLVGREFASRIFKMNIEAPVVTYQSSGGNTVSPVQTGISQFAHGGIIQDQPGGRLGLFGEAGSDEAVIPLNEQGASFMATVMAQAIGMLGDSGGSGGGGVTINFPNYVGSKAELTRMIRDELAKTSRQLGGADLFAI